MNSEHINNEKEYRKEQELKKIKEKMKKDLKILGYLSIIAITYFSILYYIRII